VQFTDEPFECLIVFIDGLFDCVIVMILSRFLNLETKSITSYTNP